MDISLTRGATTVVSDDISPNYKWCLHKNGYAVRTDQSGRTVYLHRFVLGAAPHEQVDHINGDKLDNRRENLRICSQSQNSFNKGIRKDNKTGFKGVHTTKRSSSYESTIQNGGKVIYIGRFKTPIDAAAAYDKKAVELFGEFSRTNGVA